MNYKKPIYLYVVIMLVAFIANYIVGHLWFLPHVLALSLVLSFYIFNISTVNMFFKQNYEKFEKAPNLNRWWVRIFFMIVGLGVVSVDFFVLLVGMHGYGDLAQIMLLHFLISVITVLGLFILPFFMNRRTMLILLIFLILYILSFIPFLVCQEGLGIFLRVNCF